MIISAKTAACRVAQSLCVLIATTTAALAFQPGFIHDITVSSPNGVSVMGEYYTPNQVPMRFTRVCLINRGRWVRAFTHSVPGINPLLALPHSMTCANFPSNMRVPFGLQDGSEPAQSSVPMVMSLSAFRGGIVTFDWR